MESGAGRPGHLVVRLHPLLHLRDFLFLRGDDPEPFVEARIRDRRAENRCKIVARN